MGEEKEFVQTEDVKPQDEQTIDLVSFLHFKQSSMSGALWEMQKPTVISKALVFMGSYLIHGQIQMCSYVPQNLFGHHLANCPVVAVLSLPVIISDCENSY